MANNDLDMAVAIFHPEAVLPAQLVVGESTIAAGERRMWLEALEQAAKIYTGMIRNVDPRIVAETARWFAEESYDIGGFGFVCEALKLEASVIRRGLMASIGSKAAALRFRRMRRQNARSTVKI